MMKKLMIGATLALVASNALAAAPGCIGGCMGTAPNVGNIDLPVGYMCKSGWPNYAPVSCIAPVLKESTWTFVDVKGLDGKTHRERQ